MLFRKDPEQESQVWVDRGIDRKVDSFEPCGFCRSWLGKHVLMAVYGRDPEAWSLAGRCMGTLEKMQA